MTDSINSEKFKETIRNARKRRFKKVNINGETVQIPCPFPSPGDWRDKWIYFLMIDRFNNPEKPPRHLPWDGPHNSFQGGSFNGIREKLDYLKDLGVGAIWMTPVLKNCIYNPNTYHGYGIQDFLSVDPRFGSDQDNPEIAEKELLQLIDEAHARGIYIIFDIVLNHTGNVFQYKDFKYNAPWRDFDLEPYEINWRDDFGVPRPEWTEAPVDCHPDAAIRPRELRRNTFFRRRGVALPGHEEEGDFSSLKEMNLDYTEISYERGHHHPVQEIIIKIYQYVIAKFDIDGFRIDTLKHVPHDFARIFGNAMREFAQSTGKKNFFTFGEVWDSEEKIAGYIGKYAEDAEQLIGVDAALDFPLMYSLTRSVKGETAPSDVIWTFKHRKNVQKNHLSSHGEASRFFVTFLDNHDNQTIYYKNNEKIKHYHRFNCKNSEKKCEDKLAMAVGCLFTLQGIPCIYYGTEQGLNGEGDNNDTYIREALWGKPNAFDMETPYYKEIKNMAEIRASHAALRYGRQYFRQISGNSYDFGISTNVGGILAFSRILNDTEIVIAANMNPYYGWEGFVIVEYSVNIPGTQMKLLYSNKGNEASLPGEIQERKEGESNIYNHVIDYSTAGYPWRTYITKGPTRFMKVNLNPLEIQILGRLDY